MTCIFHGLNLHDLPFPWDDESPAHDSLLQRLIKEVVDLCEAGVTDFYCGTALGCDRLFAEVVEALQDAYPIGLHPAAQIDQADILLMVGNPKSNDAPKQGERVIIIPSIESQQLESRKSILLE